MHRGPAAYVLGPPPSRSRDLELEGGALENGADLRVNDRQKIRHYRARSTEERRRRRRRRNSDFFYFARRVRKIALYSDLIHSFDLKSAVEHDGGV